MGGAGEFAFLPSPSVADALVQHHLENFDLELPLSELPSVLLTLEPYGFRVYFQMEQIQ